MEVLFQKLFPWHLLLDQELRIVKAGRTALKMIPGLREQPLLEEIFTVHRPRIQLCFKELQAYQDSMFLFQYNANPEIQLKGQITHIAEQEQLLFVFTPVIREVDFLKKLGITLNDIPFYDNTLELLFSLQATNRALGDSQFILKSFEEKVNQRTRELQAKNEEILARHKDFLLQQQQIQHQTVFLEEKNRKLQKARELIHSKNRELKLYSVNLEREVQQRTQDLTAINRELLEQNNQLEQFAFIVAHNLRAPIARILGLINLMQMESLVVNENSFYIGSIGSAAQRLEEVIRDLNIILEIRKGIGQAFQTTFFSKKLERVQETLSSVIADSGVTITADFTAADKIYSISSYLENILYNLIGNAIKYRNPEIPLVVKVSTAIDGEYICLVVSDNGIGFDMDKHKANMFKLYKRFHDHVEGKGLGLYMIKTQTEALGGRIEVTSKPFQGSTFKIYFRQH